MKNEEEACTIYKNSVIAAGGKCEKIPDPSSDFQMTIQRPFDLFGALDGIPFYAEMKHMKGGLFSFDLQDVKDHQIENLLSYKYQLPSCHVMVILAVNIKRGDNRYYIFDNVVEFAHRREARENYKQKELLTLPYYRVSKNLIDLTQPPLNGKEKS